MPVYDLQALGCKLTGNPADAAANMPIIQKAFQDARGGNPGPIEVPMGAGLPVLNGQLDLAGANMVFRGLGGMGTVSDWGPTSLIRGFGPGDTLKVSQGGCRVSGLCWQGDGQGLNDSFLRVTETQVDVFDHFMDSPSIGIKLAFPFNMPGQFWARNILMGGTMKTAGMDLSGGSGAIRLEHIRMFNGDMQNATPQPPYGVLVKAAGEFFMSSSDICNCGVNLGIVPGMDGVANSFVQNINVSDCDFDNGNQDQIRIRPVGSSFVLSAQLVNTWCSSVDNGAGTWPGNGLTADASMSHTAVGFPSICNLSVSNSVFQNAKQHCGGYFKGVQGLGIDNCTAGANYVGFQTYNCVGTLGKVRAGAYVAGGGNTTWGVIVEKSNLKFNPGESALDGNGKIPGYRIIP